MATIQVTTTVDLDDTFLDDMVTTAVEGGTDYWAAVSDYHWGDGEPTTVRLHELNDDESGYREEGVLVDAATIAKGMQRLATVYPCHFERLVHPNNDWDHDADDADMVVQLALFGELKYG